MKAPAKAVQEKNPQRDGKIPFLCGFILYHIGKPFDFLIWYKIIIALRRGGACRCRDPPQAENPVNRILFYVYPMQRIYAAMLRTGCAANRGRFIFPYSIML